MLQEGPQARAGEAVPRKAPIGICSAKRFVPHGKASLGTSGAKRPRCRMFGREALRVAFMRQGVAEGLALPVGPCRAARGLRPRLVAPTARAAKRARGGVRGAHPATPAPEECRGNCPCHATRRENKRPPVARRSFGGFGGSLRLRLPALQEQAETEQAQHRRGRLGDHRGPRLRAAERGGCVEFFSRERD